MKAYLIRHGQSVWNAEHRWAGRADPPLTPEGMASAEELASSLRGVGFGWAVTSPLLRASQTAGVLCDRLSLPPASVVPDLAEREAGAWTGLTSDEIERRWPGQMDRWRGGGVVEPPGSEPWPAFVARVVRALLGLRAPGEAPLLVVAHKGVMRALEHHSGVGVGSGSNLAGCWFSNDGDRLEVIAPSG